MRRCALLLAGMLAACEEPASPPPVPGVRDPAASQSAPPPETSTLDEAIPRPSPGDATRALALLQQGLASQAAGRTEEARRLLEQAVDADPAHRRARLELGFLLLEPGAEQNHGEALRQFRTARTLEADDAEAILGEGIARQALGDLAAAEPLLRQALTQPLRGHDREAPGRLALAQLLAASGRDPRQEFDRVLELWPAAGLANHRARALVALADWHMQSHRFAEAETLLREAITLDRSHVRAHYLLFRALARQGKTEEAAHFQEVHELLRQLLDHPSKAFLENHELRMRLRRELVEAYPEHVRARLDLIRDLLEMRRYQDALGELALEARAHGLTAEVLYLTARAKAGMADLTGARQAHDQMRRMQPNAPAGVTQDILDEWQKTTGVDAAMYHSTLQEWLRGSP